MSYNSVLKSFTDRGPNKRKVKPVEAQMLNFSFGGSDSEEDEDFKIDGAHSGSDSGDSNEDSSSGSDSGNEDSASGEEDKAMTVDQLLATANDTEKKEKNVGEPHVVKESGTEIASQFIGKIENAEVKISARKEKLLICGICLEHQSTEEDELIQCDSCGMIVHEGCYGDIEDDKPQDDSDSDSPTEPWFCDSCKANASPVCELCPVAGGIFKQTDTGKWVHLICALYTPGVGFRDVTSLQTVVLEDVQPSKWGAKECLLCEDSRFCKTGICIGCDAGLCKSHFHVTCAQKNGLLSEIPDVEDADEDMADPLYAHCKQHADSDVVKSKIHSWLSYTSGVREFKPSDDPDEKVRISLALNRARADYKELRRALNPPSVPREPIPRLLSSCPEACEKLTRKAEMLGYSVESAVEMSKMLSSSKVSRTINPTLSCDFINYFYNRESKLKVNVEMQDPLQEENEKLKKEHVSLQDEYEKAGIKLNEWQKQKEKLTEVMNVIHKSLETLLGTEVQLPLPWRPKPKVKEDKERDVMLENMIHTCFRCKGINDQHLMTDCDMCHNYYHLSCCIPPLTRMPKKSTKYLWQCYECDPYDSEEEVEATDTGDEVMAKRRPRRNVIIPTKFVPNDPLISGKRTSEYRKIQMLAMQNDPSDKESPSSKRKRGRPCKVKDNVDYEIVEHANKSGNQKDGKVKGNDISVEGPVAKRAKSSERKEKGKQEKKIENCWVCKEDGESENLVQCDECLHSFHFRTCLNPPYTKTPKRRGYGWICVDCDESSSESVKDVEEDTGSEQRLRQKKEICS